jgi:hypothetical protein
MLGSMPNVQVTTDPTTVFAIVAVIGALAVLAVVISFWAGRLPAVPDEPPAPPKALAQPVEPRQPAPQIVDAERSQAVTAPTTTPAERRALFAIVGMIFALVVIGIIVSVRAAQLSYASDGAGKRD